MAHAHGRQAVHSHETMSPHLDNERQKQSPLTIRNVVLRFVWYTYPLTADDQAVTFSGNIWVICLCWLSLVKLGHLCTASPVTGG